MTLGGWLFMVLSWAIIIGLTWFCFAKIFKKEPKNIKVSQKKKT